MPLRLCLPGGEAQPEDNYDRPDDAERRMLSSHQRGDRNEAEEKSAESHPIDPEHRPAKRWLFAVSTGPSERQAEARDCDRASNRQDVADGVPACGKPTNDRPGAGDNAKDGREPD
jgi:hypothetical protein